MSQPPRNVPEADSQTGLQVLKGMLRDRSVLTALSLMHRYVGSAFRINMPRFRPVVLVGPESNRQLLVVERHKLNWRSERDPVTKLLCRGVLVTDGEEHDRLRTIMDPPLQRRHVTSHVPLFWRYTDEVTDRWQDGGTYDMLVEMRRFALLSLLGALFQVDFAPDLDRMWQPVLELLEYISPGLWILWPGMPRPRYRHAIDEMDRYLYGIIAQRRQDLAATGNEPDPSDLLGQLVTTPDMSDSLIRDQLLTMLIAGHDTSTALLAWALCLLGSHPQIMAEAQAEVDEILPDPSRLPREEDLSRLQVIDQVIKECLRLYPPIHVGNRVAAENLQVQGYDVPAGTRIMVSIYLSHRDPDHWENPEQFCPARFRKEQGTPVPPFTYLPFGGGPRNCIGAAFAQVEARTVLARLLQTFQFQLLNGPEVRPYMGATLEPRPGVLMQVRRRTLSSPFP